MFPTKRGFDEVSGVDNMDNYKTKTIANKKYPSEEKRKFNNQPENIRTFIKPGTTLELYSRYFHHLLRLEEIETKKDFIKHSMFDVTLKRSGENYLLFVPALVYSRPSFKCGTKIIIRPQSSIKTEFEGVITDIKKSGVITISDINEDFQCFYNESALFAVRFQMCRKYLDNMLNAIALVVARQLRSRLFPTSSQQRVELQPIQSWFNPLVKENDEQRTAVQNILSGTSCLAPYLVFGPPGTGKTMTIVEAILQIVVHSSDSRVLVCAESNSAADHIATMLLKFREKLNISNFLIRVNSRSRKWTIMPAELYPVSNGSSSENSVPRSNVELACYRVVVTTLLHAAKYGSSQSQAKCKLEMTHLFIDEAAQASEPASLVPLCGLLAPHGQLVLAGDPKQLGPVCLSHVAKSNGLGISLMERLMHNHLELYQSNGNYITKLVKNFRNHPEILHVPNEHFYKNDLKACAPLDPLSSCSVLGLPGCDKAVVFHGIYSAENRTNNIPSYFNDEELDLLQIYIEALIQVHHVQLKDIGIITPYCRQVYYMKRRLTICGYDDIDVGTVEAFQGREKRIILVSTVRSEGLGFMTDPKRFNVLVTRAKAKLIIIGHPGCLKKDQRWRSYMDHCKALHSYVEEEPCSWSND